MFYFLIFLYSLSLSPLSLCLSLSLSLTHTHIYIYIYIITKINWIVLSLSFQRRYSRLNIIVSEFDNHYLPSYFCPSANLNQFFVSFNKLLSPHTSRSTSKSIYIYIYIYVCVCVCVCVWNKTKNRHKHTHILGGTITLSSQRKQLSNFILKRLLKKSIKVTWLCSRADMDVVGSRVQQETSEEGRMTDRPKRCEYNNKDEDNSLKTLNDKNH